MKKLFFLLFLMSFSCFWTNLQSDELDGCCLSEENGFIYVGGGGSWSTKSKIHTDPAIWDPSPQGYNSNLGSSEFYTFGLGYHCTPLFSLSVDLNYRPEYKYKKFQTSTASQTQGFLGNKTRFFKLSSLSCMVNAFLNKQGNAFSYSSCGYSIAPFIGVGVGVSYNKISDFHSVLPLTVEQTAARVASIMSDKLQRSFAAQAIVGLVAKITNRLSVEVGYRYFYAGKFKTNNYLVDVATGFLTPKTTSPWTGRFQTNDVFLNFNYNL